MKLSEFRRLVPGSNSIGLTQIGAEMLLADIDAEIAKARAGSNIDRRVSSLAGGLDDFEKRLSTLESSEVELRQHCQGNVPMSVFNDLKKRVDSLSSDTSSLENAVTRELRALAERVKALEAGVDVTEDVAFQTWRREPWPDGVTDDRGNQIEEAFRAGFRAGRK